MEYSYIYIETNDPNLANLANLANPANPANQPTNPPTRHHPAAQPTVRGSVFLINKPCARRGWTPARAVVQKACVFTMTFDGSNRS